MYQDTRVLLLAGVVSYEISTHVPRLYHHFDSNILLHPLGVTLLFTAAWKGHEVVTKVFWTTSPTDAAGRALRQPGRIRGEKWPRPASRATEMTSCNRDVVAGRERAESHSVVNLLCFAVHRIETSTPILSRTFALGSHSLARR